LWHRTSRSQSGKTGVDRRTAENKYYRKTYAKEKFGIHDPVPGKLFPAGNFYDVVAELRLDRADNLTCVVLECHFLKFGYHLSFAKPAKIPTGFSRGAGREPAGDLVKLFTFGKSFEYLVCLVFSLDENM
jgi:hypothetical protein